MIYMSEDSKSSLVRLFSSLVYGEKSVVYTNGNNKISVCLREILEKYPEKTVLVYLDLVPGNNATLGLYANLLDAYKSYENVYIIPILCSESCVIRSLKFFGFQVPDLQIGILDGKNSFIGTKYELFDKEGKRLTMEKVVKEFHKYIPLVNKSNLYKKYFKEDYFSVGNRKLSLNERCARFIFEHGCFYSNNFVDKYYNCGKVSISQYIEDYLNYFNKVCSTNGFVGVSDKRKRNILNYYVSK